MMCTWIIPSVRANVQVGLRCALPTPGMQIVLFLTCFALHLPELASCFLAHCLDPMFTVHMFDFVVGAKFTSAAK